ncbi:hypothetical protein DL95DRAFT_71345 [Leptodontidium sp. 2 PMI_412]|nr:hypothetical protein DL95DRAFT_71345 [Leptodontidium sp. 2 PMI_412]
MQTRQRAMFETAITPCSLLKSLKSIMNGPSFHPVIHQFPQQQATVRSRIVFLDPTLTQRCHSQPRKALPNIRTPFPSSLSHKPCPEIIDDHFTPEVSFGTSRSVMDGPSIKSIPDPRTRPSQRLARSPSHQQQSTSTEEANPSNGNFCTSSPSAH